MQLDYNITLDSRSRDTVFIELFDDKPVTRDNFMAYVNAGRYNGSFMHRLSRNFVIQGGGFYPEYQPEPALPEPKWSLKSSPEVRVDLDGNPATPNPTIVNEYSVGTIRSNVRGTIAMARASGIVNSATSQWFVNYKNNSFLDTVDQGFTVFAEVRGDGMSYFDALNSSDMVIANLNQDLDDNGLRDTGPSNPFGSSSTDGVPLLFGLLANLVILEDARRVDYLGSGTVIDIPPSGWTYSQRDVFIDTGATFTGSGRLIINRNRTLGIREGQSIGRPVAVLGTLAPGLQNGMITVPAYEQTAEGTLAIDIRGTTVDTHYDRLAVTNLAKLDGTLEVSFLNQFHPRSGNSFTVLTAGAIQGDFAEYNLPELAPSFHWSVTKTATAITLRVNGGDYDGNGRVEAADYAVWRSQYGESVSRFSGADGNGDGKVDAGDYVVWRNNLGFVAPMMGGGSLAATVPEPAISILLFTTGVWLLATCRPRRQRLA